MKTAKIGILGVLVCGVFSLCAVALNHTDPSRLTDRGVFPPGPGVPKPPPKPPPGEHLPQEADMTDGKEEGKSSDDENTFQDGSNPKAGSPFEHPEP